MTDFLIRPACPADAPALKAIVAAAYAPYAETIPDLPPVAEGLEADIRDHTVLVAEGPEGRLAGGIVLILTEDHAILANVAVAPEAGGRGLGRALIAEAEAAARAMAAPQLHLATHAQMPGNLALYQRLGWREVEREGVKVKMVKDLT